MVACILLATFNVYADNCESVINPKLLDEIKSILRIIQIAAPVILLFLTSLDFAKVVFADNKDGINKAKNNFLKRGVAVLIIFFAPMIISLILDLVQESNPCVETFSYNERA